MMKTAYYDGFQTAKAAREVLAYLSSDVKGVHLLRIEFS